MIDIVEDIKGSIVQHGPHNNRIYVMKLCTIDINGLIATLDDMAKQYGYGKIFAKIPASAWSKFKSTDYIKEAAIPHFFFGKEDGFFISKYFSAERQREKNTEKLKRYIKHDESIPAKDPHRKPIPDEDITECKPVDAEEMSLIFHQVFKSYPFPIQNSGYLKHMMNEGVLYFCIRRSGRIAALAAAEIDLGHQNAEMTDFATLAKWRGNGFATVLIKFMEKKTRTLGIKTAYTIARAESHGINSVFKNNGYRYAGYLTNNSQICGSIQSMIVWYKHLTPSS